MKTTCQSGDPATDEIADCGLSTPKMLACSRPMAGVADGRTLGIARLTAPQSAVRDLQS